MVGDCARDTPEDHPYVSRAELRKIRKGLLIATPQTASDLAKPNSGNSWRAIFPRKDLSALMIGYFSFGYIAWVFSAASSPTWPRRVASI
jgi:MFS transporter, ACS family, glucarate transporter